MKTSTAIFVGVATSLNVGLWFWSQFRERQPTEKTAVHTRQTGHQEACPTLTSADVVDQAARLAAGGLAKEGEPRVKNPDQPWLSTVRDNVLQKSQSPSFIDKLVITGIDCQDSKCSVTGSTHPSADGEWHGSADVAALMAAMNDGQIAGGDTGRSIAVNLIQPNAQTGGVDYSMTVEDIKGAPQINPCRSTFDAWKATHPEDFIANPDFPTIRNYDPQTVVKQ